jgi:hypothetical protein
MAESSIKTYLLTLVFAGVFVFTMTDGVSAKPMQYQVSEFVRVLSPDSFECRLMEYGPAPSVRFRVFLPESEVPTPNQTREDLAQILNSAEKIELRNINFKNYFRLEADLWIDGEPYRIKTQKEPVQNEKDADIVRPVMPEIQRPRFHQAQYPVKPYRPPIRRRVSVSSLLETVVDCSILTDETPIDEALTFLSKSVNPPLPLIIYWSDLENNALIDKDTPIGAAGFGRMKVRQALRTILHSVGATSGGPGLVMMSEDGILKLGTRQTLYGDMTTEVYDIRDLAQVPSLPGNYSQNNFNGFGRNRGY